MRQTGPVFCATMYRYMIFISHWVAVSSKPTAFSDWRWLTLGLQVHWPTTRQIARRLALFNREAATPRTGAVIDCQQKPSFARTTLSLGLTPRWRCCDETSCLNILTPIKFVRQTNRLFWRKKIVQWIRPHGIRRRRLWTTPSTWWHRWQRKTAAWKLEGIVPAPDIAIWARSSSTA